MTQVGDRHLAQRAVVIGQRDPAIEDPWMRVLPRDAFQLNPSPRGTGRPVELPHQSLGAPAQGNEVNSQPVELIELGIGRQLGIEDQFLRIRPVRSFQNWAKRRISAFWPSLRSSPLA